MGIEREPLTWGRLTLARSFGRLLAPELLARPVPSLPTVDCDHCRRVDEGTATERTKCCDIVPRLPSFLVGEILSRGGHPVVMAWIKEGRGDPFGIQVPPVLAEAYRAARRPGRFGRPCPLLLDGRCSVYGQRPSACIDYHCYYPTDLHREAFACLSTTLMLLEREAEKRLVLESGLDVARVARALSENEEGDLWDGTRHEQSVYGELWQHHAGREADFYRDAYRRLDRWNPRRIDRPRPPTDALRARLRQGSIPAHLNDRSVEEQQATLLWYLERLSEAPERRGLLRVLPTFP